MMVVVASRCPATPGPFGCSARPRAGGWRTSGGGCGARALGEPRPATAALERAAGRSRVGGDGGADRCPVQIGARGREDPLPDPMPGRHAGICGPEPWAARPSRRRREIGRCCDAAAVQMAQEVGLGDGRQHGLRSLSPLPPRTTIWLVPKSTSCTRRRQHSRTRRPAPYSRHAIRRGAPSRAGSRRAPRRGSGRRAGARAAWRARCRRATAARRPARLGRGTGARSAPGSG